MAVPNYYFPYVPPPHPAVKPPSHPAPPPPAAKPPTHPTPPAAKPPKHSTPPPPSAKPPSHSTPPPPSAKPPSYLTPPPPPPHKPFTPPPPHVHPPPSLPPHAGPPLPPSPSPNHPTVLVIVFISFGSVFFLAFLAVALCCFLKKKKKSTIQETGVIHFDEHRKIKEAIVEGPHGPQAVVLSVEDDVHLDEAIRKEEKSEKRWPSSSSNVQETDFIHVDGHEKVKEDIVEGSDGSKAVLLTIDDDIHVDEAIRKTESSGKDGHHHFS